MAGEEVRDSPQSEEISVQPPSEASDSHVDIASFTHLRFIIQKRKSASWCGLAEFENSICRLHVEKEFASQECIAVGIECCSGISSGGTSHCLRSKPEHDFMTEL